MKKNTIRYLNDIDDLNHQYEQVVENATTKTLLFADRFPFRYLLDDYDLNYYAAFLDVLQISKQVLYDYFSSK